MHKDITGTGKETAYRKTRPKAEPGFHGIHLKLPLLFLSVLLVSLSAENKNIMSIRLSQINENVNIVRREQEQQQLHIFLEYDFLVFLRSFLFCFMLNFPFL